MVGMNLKDIPLQKEHFILDILIIIDIVTDSDLELIS